jgi:beta-galactosidase/beta-glucuronidase
LLLKFGAVDFEAKVYVNGHAVGGYKGGYTPFELDV